MGDLEPYMDENFLRQAFNQMGENFRNVKIMKNKFTGAFMGYCFLEFDDEDMALKVLHKLNGKVLPSSSPPKRFKLNHANYGKDSTYNRDFSIFVGDLGLEVDDLELYKTFASRFPSVRIAKVVLDASGRSKGFGFIRFADEYEQQQALIQMQGYTGLGSKPLRVSPATQKRPTPATVTPTTTASPTPDYSSYYYSQSYDQYPNYYQQWPDYSQYYNYSNYYGYGYGYTPDYQQYAMMNYDMSGATAGVTAASTQAAYEVPDVTIEEHDSPFDIEKENLNVMERSEVSDSRKWILQVARWISVDAIRLFQSRAVSHLKMIAICLIVSY